eukprot:GFYU01006067.1.p1 GENE.GFYU01006067.1~~GFYU01006067.1.p1  ORF type:complete len:841 (-),score=152.56 GFYU01006067.1:99-2621(-)
MHSGRRASSGSGPRSAVQAPCSGCGTILKFPQGTPVIKCAVCQQITSFVTPGQQQGLPRSPPPGQGPPGGSAFQSVRGPPGPGLAPGGPAHPHIHPPASNAQANQFPISPTKGRPPHPGPHGPGPSHSPPAPPHTARVATARPSTSEEMDNRVMGITQDMANMHPGAAGGQGPTQQSQHIALCSGCPTALWVPGRIGAVKCSVCNTVTQLRKEDKNAPSVRMNLASLRAALANANGNLGPLAGQITALFSTAANINGSFLVDPHAPPNYQTSGIDLDALREFFKTVYAHAPLKSAMVQSIQAYISGAMPAAGAENLRQFIVLLECPLMYKPEFHDSVFFKVARAIAHLPKPSHDYLVGWWSRFPPEHLRQIVGAFQQYITCRLFSNEYMKPHNDWGIVATTKVLGLINAANEFGHLIPYQEFYNDAVNEVVDFDADFRFWRLAGQEFSFCNYPFILNPATKARVLHIDAQHQMERELQDVVVRSIIGGVGGTPFLVLKVRRNNLVLDTLHQIARHHHDLKKQLRVEFLGEEGIDWGGVQKEFFQLIVRELFDPKYGMFTYDEETRTYWFSCSSPDEEEFKLIGIILGLAIYNGVILDLHFPHVVYKKLMGQRPTLDDLKVAQPSLGRGLQQLLYYDGDVEDTFCRTFTVDQEIYGQIRTVELKKNGDDIPVTNSNRMEYVSLYVKYLLDDSIEQQFTAFSQGFHMVCGGDALRIFRPEELELLICGSPDLNMEDLERGAVYDDGFTKSSRTVRQFWEIVHGFNFELKKRLLFFTTGSDRVPIKGLANIHLVISRMGPDTMRLPQAHTCFNQILLPEYKTRDKLREKLVVAINNAEGFGLK